MTTTHVFIVDTNTFKYHLEYLFAGTGAKDNFIDYDVPRTLVTLVMSKWHDNN